MMPTCALRETRGHCTTGSIGKLITKLITKTCGQNQRDAFCQNTHKYYKNNKIAEVKKHRHIQHCLSESVSGMLLVAISDYSFS